VLRHKGSATPVPLAAGIIILAALAALLAPRNGSGTAKVDFLEVRRIVEQRCVTCHAEKPSFQGFAQAPKGVMFDSSERIRAQSLQIHQQAVVARAMPPGNLTGLTDEERGLLDRWYRSGAKTD
jgi:uncharacterized membrane protein